MRIHGTTFQAVAALLVVCVAAVTQAAHDMAVTGAPASSAAAATTTTTTTTETTLSTAEQVRQERLILLEFYDATGGSSWNENEGWEDGRANEYSDYCAWTGVICTGEADLDLFQHRTRALQDGTASPTLSSSAQARVMGLDLSSNFLQGRTPPSLWQLPLLQYLNVNDNANLQVDFSTVHQAPQLAIVKASYTATASLVGLDHASLTLNIVHCTGCPLKSSIPKELLSLTNLRDLQLSACQLQGQLTGIAALSNLRNLNLFDNQLGGSLPNDMIQMVRLERFSVSRNMLTGNLDVLDAFVDLQELYVAENQFSGPLPSLAAMPRLTRVYLNQNLLTGTIPDNFLAAIVNWEPNYSDNADWIKVELSANQLTGTIPESLDDLEDLGMEFRLHDNRFVNISEALCDNDYWNRGSVKNFGCDGILCPAGTYSESGHATYPHPCQPCSASDDEYLGATMCIMDDDRSALLALYAATGGDEWINHTGWKDAMSVATAAPTAATTATTTATATVVPSICDWYGVECYQDGDTDDDTRVGRVQKISLAGNNLVGAVPKEIFNMDFLNTLNVARNPNLVVSLELLGASIEMRHLDISQTATVKLDGLELASDWFTSLVADGLNLGGTLPTQILNLTQLQILSMVECQLIGSLPEDLGMLTKLGELYLFDNNLRGTIPDSIGTMTELRYLSLAHNQLTGSLPTTLEALQKLEALSLADQVSKGGGFSGPLPTFRFQPLLKSLHLSDNQFEGTVPVQLLEGTDDLKAALKVNLANNRLNGKVPGDLSRFLNMDLDLQGNHFTELDERLCAIAEWRNGLVGAFGCDALLCPVGFAGGRQQFDDVPCVPCPLTDGDAATSASLKWMGQETCQTEFSADDSDEQSLIAMLFNRTNGEKWKNNGNWLSLEKKETTGSSTSTQVHVCDWYGISCDESRSIVAITLGANNLQGTFPTEVYVLPKLEHLSLFGNPSLTIPLEGIDNASNLRQLVLDSTGLTSLKGIGKARSLTELNVEDNKLEGELPEELFRLVHLRSLSISKNHLKGTISNRLNNLPSLETFLAADNHFEGFLPDLSGFKRAAYIDLSNNNFIGEIPRTFLNSVNQKEKIVVDLSNNNIEGTVPRELARLSRLTIHLNDNKITAIDQELCTLGGWNDYEVQKFGCNGILCPSGTSSVTGRQTSTTTQCVPCEKAEYMGSTACFSTSAARPTSVWSLLTFIATTGLGLLALA